MICLLRIGMLISYVLISHIAFAQDSASLYDRLYNLPDKVFNSINNKSEKLQAQLIRQTDKYLTRLKRKEYKLRKKLWQKDSVAAKSLFGDIDEKYAALHQKMDETTPPNQLHNVYSNRLDSMKTAISFLQQIKGSEQVSIRPDLRSALTNYEGLHNKLDQTSYIKKILHERQQYLQSQLQQFGLGKELKKFQKDVYYYREQMNEYRKAIENPSLMEAKLLKLANKIPAFRNFFRKHSELAALFGLPGNEDGTGGSTLAGLQTREMVQQSLQQRFGTGADVARAVQQNLQSAQSHLNTLKEKVNQAGSVSDPSMDNFKPNTQKTKSFLKRLEFGTNIQTVRGSNFFPITSDIGLSVGYKLNDRFSIGAGTSYKMGWGSGFRNIRITHEGVGLRSFFDVNIKGSFYASGGLEYNYQAPFSSIQQLQSINKWQQSGLLGIGKIVSVKSKIFGKTKVQLLWDFLSYRQVPPTQPLKFRIGYSLK